MLITYTPMNTLYGRVACAGSSAYRMPAAEQTSMMPTQYWMPVRLGGGRVTM